jgi:hypothetical protein
VILDGPVRVANFEAAWYYSLLVFVAVMLTVAAFVMAQSAVRPMWRAGDRGMAAAVCAAATIGLLLMLSVVTTIAVALLPAAAGRG